MKPLFVLLTVFLATILITRLTVNGYDLPLAGRIAMCAMLLFTAMGHFAYAKGMTMMLPDFIPRKLDVVYFTGIVEIAGAIGLLLSSTRNNVGWLLIAFFILILPANIYAAIKRVDYQNGTYNGPGINYLWFRIPLQLLFILWTYYSTVAY